MTSMQALGPNKFSWDGDKAVQNIEVKNPDSGECAGISKLQLVAIPCDEKHIFMCEKKDQPKSEQAITEKTAA
jgi:hypothetical protein